MVRIGTAGWQIPKPVRDKFAADGTSLERYAALFSCTEINSSFHKTHRASTYARWAQSVPRGFRFSVKLPKEITHKRKLVGCADLLEAFLEQSGALGGTLGPYIIQLAPSHTFSDDAIAFFEGLRGIYHGELACEPRHESWAAAPAVNALRYYRVTRVGADPVVFSGAERSEAFGGFAYYRWHGTPRTYYSEYSNERLQQFADAVCTGAATQTWCIFDNTALGAATGNALTFGRWCSGS